jgi:hypothetical protein
VTGVLAKGVFPSRKNQGMAWGGILILKLKLVPRKVVYVNFLAGLGVPKKSLTNYCF